MNEKHIIFPSRSLHYAPILLLIIAAVCLGVTVHGPAERGTAVQRTSPPPTPPHNVADLSGFVMANSCAATLRGGGLAPTRERSPLGDDHSAATSRLLTGFRNPPKEARPSTYWLWLNGYVDQEQVEKELKAFHAAGIRGVCIFDMGARGAREASPPAGPPFLSKTSVADIAHAVRIAQQLDMNVQLSVASSWDMGGTWVPPQHASMGLFTAEISVVGPADFHNILPLPPVPTKAPRRPDGQPVYQKDIAVLAFPDNIHDSATSGPGGSSSSAEPPPVCIEKRESILNLTDRLDGEGRLKWRVPEGRWTIMRWVCLNTGERLKVPSPNSDGLATDHLSHAATRAFLDHLIGKLQAQLGDLSQTALKQLYLASYEVRGPIWTPDLLEQFRRYRGYDMTPYLPVLSGKRVVSEEISQRFMYDYRKTLGDLLVDAYYRTAVAAAHAAGIGIESEAGGPGPPTHQVPVDALLLLRGPGLQLCATQAC